MTNRESVRAINFIPYYHNQLITVLSNSSSTCIVLASEQQTPWRRWWDFGPHWPALVRIFIEDVKKSVGISARSLGGRTNLAPPSLPLFLPRLFAVSIFANAAAAAARVQFRGKRRERGGREGDGLETENAGQSLVIVVTGSVARLPKLYMLKMI